MKGFALMLGAALALSPLSGCVSSSCNSNGDCSNPVAAVQKAQAGDVSAFNSADIQELTSLVSQVSGTALPAVTDTQAKALIQVIEALHLTTIDQIPDAIAAAQADPESVVNSFDQETIDALVSLANNYSGVAEQLAAQYGAG